MPRFFCCFIFLWLFVLPAKAQDEFIADQENGYKDLQLGASIKTIQQKLVLTDLKLKTMREGITTYSVADTAYLTKDGFRFHELQAEFMADKLIRVTWISSNTDSLKFNTLLQLIVAKYGDYQRSIIRGPNIIRQWYFERVVVELLSNKLTNGDINLRLSYSLRKNLQ